MPDDYVSYAHAGIVAAGGVIGYAKAGTCVNVLTGSLCRIRALNISFTGSIPSLIAGLAFGGILGKFRSRLLQYNLINGAL